jgi:hypothetical protein
MEAEDAEEEQGHDQAVKNGMASAVDHIILTLQLWALVSDRLCVCTKLAPRFGRRGSW